MILDFVDGETITQDLSLLPSTPEALQKCLLDGETKFMAPSWAHRKQFPNSKLTGTRSLISSIFVASCLRVPVA